MEKSYSINDLALMSGFTTRTLRSYLEKGLLKGEKKDGAWSFSPEEVDRFFSDPYIKEGLRIKNSAIVFDYLADMRKKSARTCVVLDVPAGIERGQQIALFFCEEMKKAKETEFKFDHDKGVCRFIITGPEEVVSAMMRAYNLKFNG